MVVVVVVVVVVVACACDPVRVVEEGKEKVCRLSCGRVVVVGEPVVWMVQNHRKRWGRVG